MQNAEAVELVRALLSEGRRDDARVVNDLRHQVAKVEQNYLDAFRHIVDRVWSEVRLYREDAEDLKQWFDKEIQQLEDKAFEEGHHAGLQDQNPE